MYITQFQFDINLTVNAYSFVKCKSCFNITQINITCTLNKTSMKFEPHSTQNEEVTTSKMIFEPCSNQTEEIASEMISKSSGKCFVFFLLPAVFFVEKLKGFPFRLLSCVNIFSRTTGSISTKFGISYL